MEVISLTRIDEDTLEQWPTCCKGKPKLENTWQDTVPLESVFPDAIPIADDLARSRSGHSFLAIGFEYCCERCEARFVWFDFWLAKNVLLSVDAADTYLWRNGETVPPISYSAKAQVDGAPVSWRIERYDTEEGTIDCHVFGPYAVPDQKSGYQVAQNEISKLWPVLTNG